MGQSTLATATLEPSAALSFEVANVTGTQSFTASGVDPQLPASAVARKLSAEFSLPQEVSWSLRNDDSSEFLDGEKAIGEQVEEGARLTMAPRAHLG